jgi:PPOX class probable F420-dependent enzyme
VAWVTLHPMTEPTADRPHMPGYGTLPADQGSGLLPWAWALGQLHRSHDFWVSTVRPDGRPHIMPVWGVWEDDALCFSSALGSRKIRNIQAGSAVSVATQDPQNPVVLEGTAEIVTEEAALGRFMDAVNAKYGTDYDAGFLSSTGSVAVRVRPTWAFGLLESDFGGSPTRWTFPR